MNTVIDFLNTIFWNYILLYGLLAVGIYFTVRLVFLQFLHFPQFYKSLFGGKSTDKSGITPFQSLCTSLASRVGTGNLAGVAVALYLGGPGAIFWMWIVALLGMATGYAESLLAQLYKTQDDTGQYRGGPAYYIARGLGQHWLGGIFAVCLIISFGLVFNAVQANSISGAVEQAFGLPCWGTGVILVILSGAIIFGGLRCVARFAEIVVPIMAGCYLLVAIYVLIVHYAEIPGMLRLIVNSAFGMEQATGGVIGYAIGVAMLNGVKRGLFSNEAGMGSAPNIAATAVPQPHHPVSQGLVQGFGPFIDTIVICTATAVMILLSGQFIPGSGLSGVQLTQRAMESYIGSAGSIFVAIAIFFFAFTSIVANYSYAENSIFYLNLDKRGGIFVLRTACLGMVMWGTVSKLDIVWNMADAAMGLMACVNLVGILALSGIVKRLTVDYFSQLKQGLTPHFDPRKHKHMRGVDLNIWISEDDMVSDSER
ncbi:MAG: alanine:cation symporter family protein [Spartobacteria bacterium]|nr:alanine:cation symporter family protein [Spartobacteria bacterium]